MLIEYIKIQKFLDWAKDALRLDSNTVNARSRQVRRGQVYRCNFGVGVGSEMQKDRPAVIVQLNSLNQTSGNTIVIPITHDTSTLPCMVPVTPVYESDGITVKLDGQANTSNIVCISKARLGDYVATLSSSDMKAIDNALAMTTGLLPHYTELQSKLNDKITYIARLKAERNAAQDTLSEIYKTLGVNDAKSAIAKLQEKG